MREDILNDPCSYVPLRLHGDDASLSKEEGFLVLSFRSVLVKLVTHLATFLVSVIPLQNIVAKLTLEPIYEALVWSVGVLASGKWPLADHSGHPFPVRS